MNWDSMRPGRFSPPAKALVTLFLLVVGPGYLAGVANIVLQHQDADLEERYHHSSPTKAPGGWFHKAIPQYPVYVIGGGDNAK